MDLALSSQLIIGTFTASTLTTVCACKYFNVPFFNPNHNRYQFYKNLMNVLPSTAFVLTQAIVINSFLVGNFVTKTPHSFMQNIENIVKYSLIAEFVYYVYHRIIHTKQYYAAVHSLHHENVEVYPFDTFHMTKLDSVFLIASLGAPILFLRMNYFENILALYVYITAAYLEHSNLLIMHHVKHHKLFICNFCILNPIFDLLVGTYK